MRRALALATAAVSLVAIAGLSGCTDPNKATSKLPRPSVAFCKAAGHYDNKIQSAKLAAQIEMVAKIAEHAPKDVTRDAHTFLDALKRRQAGDKSVIDNANIKDAIDHVNRRAGQDCGWYNNNSGM
ncbi:MAG TPA: hypothetical protein VGN59_00315 [Acidimicrobiia bacterium]|jgi:uncharacterized protein YggE